jgi:hypothetical protein
MDIAWAAPRYRVATSSQIDPCPSVERLFFDGGRARVVAGLGANNLRAAPLTNAAVVGQLEAGTQILVDSLANVCSNGIRWREVRMAGLAGWTAEAQDSTYYLEPEGG